ncbi:noggin-2-like [Pseudoliparis swirei]|uniref:noggin-2-like n=1 Tax=Pseudoliparis swirei TaxID=2059687 RepID=UPI0024BED74A|nr:noggin-2-like [Pseudoliparis swirei]
MSMARHHRPSRLMRLPESSFDPFWMSIERPSEASKCHRDGRPPGNESLPVKLPNCTSAAKKKLNLSASPELREAAANQMAVLGKEAADQDVGSLPSHVAGSVRGWLVRSAACGLSYRWVDLGPAFWPRWLRQTVCEK